MQLIDAEQTESIKKKFFCMSKEERKAAKDDSRMGKFPVNYSIISNKLNVPAKQKSFEMIENIVTERESYYYAKDFAYKFIKILFNYLLCDKICEVIILAPK